MTPDEFARLARAVTSTRSLNSVHPLKLARWHQSLFELPEPLFLQQGCGACWTQLTTAVAAIAKMSAVLGPTMQVPLRELALRQVGSWSFFVARPANDPRSFLVRWDPKSSRWLLGAADDPSNRRIVEGLDSAVTLAPKWASELDTRDEALLRETIGETPRAPEQQGVEGS